MFPLPPNGQNKEKLLSSQLVQVPNIPTNFHRPSTSRSTKLAKALEIPTPSSPKENRPVPIVSIMLPHQPSLQLRKRERIHSGYVNHVSRTCDYFSHQVSSWSLHSKHFPIFLLPPSTPYVARSDSNWNWSIWDIKSFYLSSFNKVWPPIHKMKLPQFCRFPPPATPNVTGSVQDLK